MIYTEDGDQYENVGHFLSGVLEDPRNKFLPVTSVQGESKTANMTHTPEDARSDYERAFNKMKREMIRDYLNPNSPDTQRNTDGPIDPGNEFLPSNLGPEQPWDVIVQNDKTTAKDQSKVPPQIAPWTPQLPSPQSDKPILDADKFST